MVALPANDFVREQHPLHLWISDVVAALVFDHLERWRRRSENWVIIQKHIDNTQSENEQIRMSLPLRRATHVTLFVV